jgi:hypothetical protein
MALTNTVQQNTVFGNKRILTVDMTFDSSYPTGGETVTPSDFGLDGIDLFVASPKHGHTFEFDYTNEKLKAFGYGPTLVVEESVTVTSGVGTLARLPLYIVTIEATAGCTTGAFNVIPTGETPATTECAVTFTAGTLTFDECTDMVTTALVTYIPQSAHGPLSSNSLVVDESVTADACAVALANRAIAVQYVWNDTNSTRCVLEPVGEAPSATNTAVVDITSGTDTNIDTNATDDGDTLKVTYLKYSSFPAEVAIADTDTTLSGSDPEQYSFAIAGGYNGLVIPGLGTQCVGEATTTNIENPWTGPSGTVGDGTSLWNPLQNQVQTQDSTAYTTLALPYFVLDNHMIEGSIVEVAEGTDLSNVSSVRVLIVGF